VASDDTQGFDRLKEHPRHHLRQEVITPRFSSNGRPRFWPVLAQIGGKFWVCGCRARALAWWGSVVGPAQGVVGVVAMPNRRYSAVILGGSWPAASGDEIRAVADAEAAAAKEVEQLADETRVVRERLTEATEGRFAGALYAGYTDEFEQQLRHAEYLKALSALRTKVGDDVDDAKRHMEFLDWEAHDKIEKLEQAGPVAQSQIVEIVAAAHADCAAYAAATGGGIARHTAKIAELPKPSGANARPEGSAYPGRNYQESPKPHRPGHVFAAGNDGEPRTRGSDNEASSDGAAVQGDPSRGPITRGDQNRRSVGGAGDGQGPDPATVRDGGPLSGGGIPGFPGGGLGSGGGSGGGGFGSGLLGGGSPLSAFQSGVGAGNPGAGLGGPGGAGLQGLARHCHVNWNV
jgi:hypothetical protein